jgi:formate dehydrogenase
VDRIPKAKKLKLAITAGIGSDHVDLEAAIKNGVTVAEVTYSNSISVSEHVVMMILSLIRNYIPSHQWVINGGSNIADCVSRSYDLEAMEVGTVAAGRIGLAVLKRLKPVRRQASLHGSASACGRSREGARLTYQPNVDSMVRVCEVVTINAPLHPETSTKH